MAMTDPFAHPAPRPSTLDAAYRMVAAGLMYPEARLALDAPDLPSAGVLAVAG
jgi:hypothetical protein